MCSGSGEVGLQVEDLATTDGFCSSGGLRDKRPLTDVKAGPWGAELNAGICSTVDMSKAGYQRLDGWFTESSRIYGGVWVGCPATIILPGSFDGLGEGGCKCAVKDVGDEVGGYTVA